MGLTVSRLAATQNKNLNRTELYFIDTSGNLAMYVVYNDQSDWKGPTTVNEDVKFGAGAGIAAGMNNATGKSNVFAVDGQGRLQVFTGDASGWTGPQTLDGDYASGVPVATGQVNDSYQNVVAAVTKSGSLMLGTSDLTGIFGSMVLVKNSPGLFLSGNSTADTEIGQTNITICPNPGAQPQVPAQQTYLYAINWAGGLYSSVVVDSDTNVRGVAYIPSPVNFSPGAPIVAGYSGAALNWHTTVASINANGFLTIVHPMVNTGPETDVVSTQADQFAPGQPLAVHQRTSLAPSVSPSPGDNEMITLLWMDIFVIDTQGTLTVTSFNTSFNRVGPTEIGPPGAFLNANPQIAAASQRVQGEEGAWSQTDVLLVGADGTPYRISAVDTGPWQFKPL